MTRYLIERDIPGVGRFTPEQLRDASARSCDVLRTMGPQIQWLYSFVTPDKLFCLYLADNEQLLRTHAARGGFPINRVYPVHTTIDATTAEGAGAAATATRGNDTPEQAGACVPAGR